MSKKIFTVNTPYSGASTVTLDSGAWYGHIQPGHPEMAGKLENIKSTLTSPTVVCAASDPDYVSFVSHTETNSLGHPLMVCVNPMAKSGPVVATAYYGKKYADLSKLNIKWKL